MDIHVSTHGSDHHDGTVGSPLATINAAARKARPGDTVVVHEGVYREWVKPPHGGLSNQRRITFTAAPGEHVVIKGSEEVSGWERVDGAHWKAVVDNALFRGFNPFAQVVEGDWLVRPTGDEPPVHLGEVYLAGAALYEVPSVADVRDPGALEDVVDDWTGIPQPGTGAPTRMVWCAEVHDDHTVIHANFGDADPRRELVEINVRRSVFYPEANHVDWITVRGFEMCHAATPWVPPTADQPGMVGPNWAKGWIIEDNLLHHAKCSAISLGKERTTGHNHATVRGDKPGYQYQLESVFTAEDHGWSREHIGSHVVRRNTIHDCGQNGIVGHLGCVFSTIEDNRIHRIALRRQFYGHEIAGIKLHAPIDVQIVGNHIHDCSLGLWLDWQTQGTRISGNVLHSNSRDFFVEVSHGPYVVDHNVFASPASLESFSQGGAYVGNLFLGSLRIEPVPDRATPYHRPHSTRVAGYAVIVGGDDRYVGNVFAGDEARENYRVELPEIATVGHGLSVYDGHPASFEKFMELTTSRSGDHRRFAGIKQPVMARDNVYLGAARPFEGEARPVRIDGGRVAVEAADGVVTVHADLP
ncbi:right-handed parallel beta-helix repeat-containing protein, partial [Tessaracoccus lubricantis]|uniref:right-handed parallel beta-helix repeat-containing protein n=1 Tax=Tessaracoccus lubricantis TaxID=545543 RepID=UPI00362DBD2D